MTHVCPQGSPAMRRLAAIRIAAILVLLWCGVGYARTGVSPDTVDSTGASVDSTGGPGKTRAPKRRSLKGPVVFGYFQVHYRMAFATGDDSLVDNDDFRVQRVRIGVKGDLSPKVSYDVEIDPRAPQITGVLRDAFLTLHILPRHDIRIG